MANVTWRAPDSAGRRIRGPDPRPGDHNVTLYVYRVCLAILGAPLAIEPSGEWDANPSRPLSGAQVDDAAGQPGIAVGRARPARIADAQTDGGGAVRRDGGGAHRGGVRGHRGAARRGDERHRAAR